MRLARNGVHIGQHLEAQRNLRIPNKNRQKHREQYGERFSVFLPKEQLSQTEAENEQKAQQLYNRE